jgi:hypothetical protein
LFACPKRETRFSRGHVRESVAHGRGTGNARLDHLRVRQTGVRFVERNPRLVQSVQNLSPSIHESLHSVHRIRPFVGSRFEAAHEPTQQLRFRREPPVPHVLLEQIADHFASWTITPAVWRWPERSRLTPCLIRTASGSHYVNVPTHPFVRFPDPSGIAGIRGRRRTRSAFLCFRRPRLRS